MTSFFVLRLFCTSSVQPLHTAALDCPTFPLSFSVTAINCPYSGYLPRLALNKFAHGLIDKKTAAAARGFGQRGKLAEQVVIGADGNERRHDTLLFVLLVAVALVLLSAPYAE